MVLSAMPAIAAPIQPRRHKEVTIAPAIISPQRMDRKASDLFHKAAQMHHPKESRRYQVWEDRFDDLALYSPEVFGTKLDYVHSNPVKRGLVDTPSDYAYSSARNYDSGDHSVIRVDCEVGLRLMESMRLGLGT